MISRKKATMWTLVFSYTTIGYAIISGVVLVPLYLKFIPTDLYGAWLATGNILAWLTIIDPGVSTVVGQRCASAHGERQFSDLSAYALTGITLLGGIAIVVAVTGFAFLPFLGGIVNFENAETLVTLKNAFGVGVIASALMLFSFGFASVNRALQGAFAQGLITFFSNVSSLGLTLILLFRGAGINAITYSLLLRSLILCFGGGGYLIWRFSSERISASFSSDKLKEIFNLLSFSSLGKIATLLSKNMDAVVLSRFLGPELVPVLVLTRRGFNVAEMLLNRTGNAIGPSLSHLKGENDRGKMRGIITRLLMLNVWVLGLALGGFLAFNDDFIYLWVGAEFFAGTTISYLMCILLVFTVMVTLMQTLCMALGDIKRNSVMQFVEALITFVCLLAGVYAFGIIGAVIAPLVGIVVIAPWYYPRSLGLLAALLRSDWLQLGREAVMSLVCSIVLFALFMQFEPITWSNFCLNAGAMAGLYTILLLSVSRLARQEGIGFLSLLQTKMSRLFDA